ncbi:MAG: hypothetical protein AAF915_30965 [Cyanobacteria bacterium P01_D01_bin.50]
MIFYTSTSKQIFLSKKYIITFIFTFLMCSLFFALLVFFQAGITTDKSTNARHWVYATKADIVDSTNQHKLLIVSGSNAAFGISCEMITNKTKVPCVNGGTTATLGIDYILYNARSWSKTGDTVLLPLEYMHYSHSGKPNQELIRYTFAYDLNYFKQANPMNQIRMLYGLPFGYLIDNYIFKFKDKQYHKDQNVEKEIINQNYGKLNQYGDVINNTEANMTEKLFNKIKKLKPLKLKNKEFGGSGTETIISFINWCKSNKIKVIATWPNTIWFEAYNGQEQKDYFQKIKQLYTSLGVPLIGNAKDFMYDKSMFYDSAYHLHARGVRQRTQQLIDLLEPYLKDIKN